MMMHTCMFIGESLVKIFRSKLKIESVIRGECDDYLRRYVHNIQCYVAPLDRGNDLIAKCSGRLLHIAK
jgi:hypothetical protein